MPHYLPSLMDTKSIVPMSRELSETFIKCTLAEAAFSHANGGKVDLLKKEMADQMGFPGKLLWSRLISYGEGKPVEVSVGVTIVVISQCQTPGLVVLWAFTLNRLGKMTGKPVDIQVLSNTFPMGFPDEKGEDEIWDAQKGVNWGENASENMLDFPHLLSSEENAQDKKEWCKWLKT